MRMLPEMPFIILPDVSSRKEEILTMYQKLFLHILELSAAHTKCRYEIFRKLDFPDAHPKILYILRSKDGLLQKELAEICKVTPPTMTNLLSKMLKSGLIYREKVLVSGGKRGFRIHLTEAGKKKADIVYDEFEILEKKGLQNLSEEEVMLLFSLMERVTQNLS